MTDYNRERYKPIMVKAQVRSCLMRIAGMKRNESGAPVSQGDVIIEMLERNYPEIWKETQCQP